MKKTLSLISTTLLLVAICCIYPGNTHDASAEEFFTISIALSPETIVLSNKAAGLCGIHTNIGYWAVDTSTLRLSSNWDPVGIKIDVAKPDSHGNLIVMVQFKKVKTLVSVPFTTLTLSGYTKQGIYFDGSDIVRVKEK